MMSLNSEEEGQDDFDETIHMVFGTKSEKKSGKKIDKDSTQSEKGDMGVCTIFNMCIVGLSV